MSSAGYQARVPRFLVQLLRRGAPVIAATPRDVPDLVVDPAPIAGWRRISAMCETDSELEPDSLLMRACRYVVLVPLVFRLFVLPVTLLPSGLPAATTLIALVLLALNTLGIVWVLRVVGLRYRAARGLLLLDAFLAVSANLAVAATTPPGSYGLATAVSWMALVGSVALWTVAWGIPSGAGLTLLSVPLQLAMCALAGREADTAELAANAAVLGVALVTATGGLMLVGLGTRLALGIGIRRGQQAQDARVRRELHDTVLQALEAMALPAPGDGEHAAARLAELRGIARAQAIELRGMLSEPADTPPAGLGEDLTVLATEMAREGLRAQLVFADVDDSTLPEARRRAVRDAAREALRNTIKHSGTNEVVLCVEERDGGIAVIARDHGTGFDADRRPAGFGISESISARLTEVGGHSRVDSQPGRGTRVTLWVPR
ncbi:signal transduction histidine kinase [Kutzneria viridogrisea]|nr:ATP-binding protein [Kutzneria albida]MBA8923015.1 signal transduction histidine kinase [Kutzneria viridogrisea]